MAGEIAPASHATAVSRAARREKNVAFRFEEVACTRLMEFVSDHLLSVPQLVQHDHESHEFEEAE